MNDVQGPIGVPVADPLKMAWYELSDLGNARRLRDLAGGKLLWVDDHWQGYDGRRWSREDGKRLAHLTAHEVALHVSAEAAAILAEIESGRVVKDQVGRWEERATALFKHAVMSGNANKTAAMLMQAQNLMFATRDDFDRDPLCINVANGTLRFFETGDGWKVRRDPHDPADMISRVADAEWLDTKHPDAGCPTWDAHMATVLPDPAVRAFFQACAGYGATGSIREQVIFILQGKGGDGKSTCMNVLRETLGGYATKSDVQTFMAGALRSGADATPDLARLAGDTRLVTTAEPKVGGMLDESRIKDITGGEPIQARELHGAPFTFDPRCKIFFQCNRKPRVSGDDDGIWRRIIVIMFPHQFKDEAINKRIMEDLLAEKAGVLRWVVDGVLQWLNAGELKPPASVKEATDDYRRASNPFGEWFADHVDTSDPKAVTPAQDLFDSYKTFCADNGVDDRGIMNSTSFGRALGDKQLIKFKSHGGRVHRRGCRLRGGDELFQAAKPVAGDDGPGVPDPRDVGPMPGWDD
jgi:putative DNA primase/helicase